MIYASSYFAKILNSDFAEGKAFKKEGKVDIILYDDDAAALEMVLNMVHSI